MVAEVVTPVVFGRKSVPLLEELPQPRVVSEVFLTGGPTTINISNIDIF